MRLPTLAGIVWLAPSIVLSQPRPLTLADCASIADNTQRLACFDQLAANAAREETEKGNQHLAKVEEESLSPSDRGLAQHWELNRENKHGLFVFRPHGENYALLANYSFAPNTAPFSPLAGLASPGDLSHIELDFQLSFKMKLLEDVSNAHADLWFGYTQQSFWQAYNPEISSPFRETDFQPELMTVIPVDFSLLGMHARFVNIGLVHQSNGRGEALSRSWNRIYAQLGMEQGNFTLLGRVWQRIHESASEDDNPDILDFMGYGDINGTYRWRGHEFSVLARHNFRTDRGAVQLGWAFPLMDHLKGYVQIFSGYGQSLIDYNYSQKSIGIGVLIGY